MGLFSRKPNVNPAAARFKEMQKAKKSQEGMIKVLGGFNDTSVTEEEPKKEVSFLGKIADDVRDAIKQKYNIDIEDELLNPTELYTVDKLERISRIKKYYIEHTLFNKEKFPKDTSIFYFDDVFNDLYDNIDDYYSSANHIAGRLERYLKEKGVEHCCIKLGQEEFLYFYPNTVANDAVEYNISLVDKNNEVKFLVTYQEDGQTHDGSVYLEQILSAEVNFLDLADNKAHREIGDMPPEKYTSERYPLMDRIRIKNDILLDLYESKRYTKESLEVIREALNENLDIGYILNPCFSADQMRGILDIVRNPRTSVRFLHDLRLFSTNIGTQFKKPFSPHEYIYIMSEIWQGKIGGFSSPEKLAMLKLNFYKDEAYNSPNNEVIFRLEDRFFALTKPAESAEEPDDFKIEEVIYEGTNEVDRIPVYSHFDNVSSGSLDTVLSLLQEKYREKDNDEIVRKAMVDAVETVTDENKTGHIRILHAKDGSIIQVEGIRVTTSQEDQTLAMLTGSIGAHAVSEDDAGVTISIIENNTSKIIYTDDKSIGITNTLEDALEEISKHGKLSDYDERISTPLDPYQEYKTAEKSKDLETILFEGKYTPMAKENIEEIRDTVMMKGSRFFWQSTDKAVTLEFVPYKSNYEGRTFKECNVFMIKDGERTPIYVHELSVDDNGKVLEHFSGDIDDIVDVVIQNRFELSDRNKNTYQTKTINFIPSAR